MIGSDGFESWQYAQGFGMFTLALTIIFAIWHLTKQRGQWRTSLSFAALLILVPTTIGLLATYRIATNDLWHARAQLHEAYEIFSQAEQPPEVVETNKYGPISIFTSRRPTQWQNCQPGRYGAGGSITLAEPADLAYLERLAQHLEGDGYEIFREYGTRQAATLPSAKLHALQGEESYGYALIEGSTTVRVNTDATCESDFEVCELCVDAFPELLVDLDE